MPGDMDALFASIHRKLDLLAEIVGSWNKGITADRVCLSCGKKLSPNFYLLKGRHLGLPLESLVQQWNDGRVEILCCECYESGVNTG